MERMTDYDGGVTGLYHRARYELAKKFCVDKEVIDIACGPGVGTKMINEVASCVTGIDPCIPKDSTDKLFVHGHIETLEPSSCDVITSFETIEHTISLDLSVRMLASALRDSGQLILSYPNGWGETEFHLHDTNSWVIPIIERNFVVNQLYGQCRKSHIKPVKIENDDLLKYENVIVVATKKNNILSELSYDERFSLLYKECLHRQKNKVSALSFKIGIFPARLRTKWKRLVGI